MVMGGDYWLRHIRCHLLGVSQLRHKEGLGYGDVKFLAALGAGIHGPSCHDWFSLLPHSLASRSYWFAYERKRVIKKPAAVGPFLAAAGFVVGWDSLLAGLNL